MYFVLLIIISLSLIILIMMNRYQENFAPNYANDIFSIHPPYKMAKKYNPDKLGPFRILKYNFLNFPIPG